MKPKSFNDIIQKIALDHKTTKENVLEELHSTLDYAWNYGKLSSMFKMKPSIEEFVYSLAGMM